MVVVRVLDMVNTEVVKAANADDIEQQYAPRLRDERDLDGVETEADGFPCAEDSTEHANVMRELLRGVCDGANPVIDDVMPELLRVSPSALKHWHRISDHLELWYSQRIPSSA